MVCPFAFRAIAIDSLCRPAITNVCLSRFFTMRHPATAPLPPRGNLVPQLLRCFSFCSSSQRSKEEFSHRKDMLTASKFSEVLGIWKGTGRVDLWHNKVFLSTRSKEYINKAMEWGKSNEETAIEKYKSKKYINKAVEWGKSNEETAIEKYKSITGHYVRFSGLATHPKQQLNWLGAAPDGLLGSPPNEGLLEVKCPYPFHKGKACAVDIWSRIPFSSMPQIQGQMEILNREWVDLFCWTPSGSLLFRVHRDRGYWDLMYKILHEFWWKNVVPARAALSAGGEEAAMIYVPSPGHKLARKVFFESRKLATEAKLLHYEFRDRVEIYRR